MPQVTGVMVGEGEETFLELARYYIEKKGRWQISGELRSGKTARSFTTDGGK